MPNSRRSYVAKTVTLTTSGTVYRLIDLLNALLPVTQECEGTCRELSIQNAAGNTVSVFVGDSDVSSTNAGYELAAGATGAVGASRLYRGPNNVVLLSQLYVVAGANNQKLNVEVNAF